MARDVAYTQGGFFVEATDIEAFTSRDEYFGGVTS